MKVYWQGVTVTLEERIEAIERHLFGRAYTDQPQVTEVPSPADPAPEEIAAEVAADVAADVPADVAEDVPVHEGGPASV